MQIITVIGGGASGLIAAIYAARNNNKVVILEKRNICGKKILVTGNGKCNFWNEDQNISHYHSTTIANLYKINTIKNRKEILSFFDKLGIIPYIKNGYYYPYSKEATTIRKVLLEEIKKLKIEIKNDFKVDKIIKKENLFYINPEKENFKTDKVILATGSLAYYNDIDANIGYDIAKSFGHNIIKPLPALVQLTAAEEFLSDWRGARSDVMLSLYSNNKKIKEETGEILLTDYGISGICVFNISSIATRLLDEGRSVSVEINFIPWYKGDDFISWLDNRTKKVKNMPIEIVLEGFLNSKIVNTILKIVKVAKNENWKELTLEKKKKIANLIYKFNLKIISTKTFKEAQVCSGGVKLDEIIPETMESKKEKGLYIIGEILDVDGDCGGYNLSFAFISGMLAGKSAGEFHD